MSRRHKLIFLIKDFRSKQNYNIVLFYSKTHLNTRWGHSNKIEGGQRDDRSFRTLWLCKPIIHYFILELELFSTRDNFNCGLKIFYNVIRILLEINPTKEKKTKKGLKKYVPFVQWTRSHDGTLFVYLVY